MSCCEFTKLAKFTTTTALSRYDVITGFNNVNMLQKQYFPALYGKDNGSKDIRGTCNRRESTIVTVETRVNKCLCSANQGLV